MPNLESFEGVVDENTTNENQQTSSSPVTTTLAGPIRISLVSSGDLHSGDKKQQGENMEVEDHYSDDFDDD